MPHDSLLKLLRERFAAGIARVVGTAPENTDPMVRAAGDPQFGDYQCNVAMSLAKTLKAKPREIAARIVAEVQPALEGVAGPLEIAGPGFINIRLKPEFLAQYLGEIPAPTGMEEVKATGLSEPEAEARGTPKPIARSRSALAPDRLGLAPVEHPQRIVVEYSQPNIAKQMHVGHLRSTIIGDVFARVLEFEGHEVIRQNHIGDWGTQFGRAILALWHLYAAEERSDPAYVVQRLADLGAARKAGSEQVPRVLEELRAQHERDLGTDLAEVRAGTDKFMRFLDAFPNRPNALEETETAYRFVNLVEELAEDFPCLTIHNPVRAPDWPLYRVSRELTAMLQKGGPGNETERKAWECARGMTLRECEELYGRLGVLLKPEDVRGESFYNDRLPTVIAELRTTLGDTAQAQRHASGVGAEVRDDQGAVVVYLYDDQGQPLFKNADGEILGMIVQKSDGAHLYATTDLAAIRFRLKELKFDSGVGAQRIIYVTDARQKLHFQMFFAAARAAGWITDQAVDHVTFGSVLGPDRKPLKTRAGGTIKLSDLLDEAERRAYQLLKEREQQQEPEADWQTGGGPVPNRSVATAIEAGPQHAPWTLRVHSLAKELGITSKDIIERCRAEGIDLKNHMAALSPSVAESIRQWFGGSGRVADGAVAPADSDAQQREIARRVGIAALKYADLRNDRNADYVFDWDKMLALTGNTAPYMMYAYARIRSIYRKAAERIGAPDVYAPGVALPLADPTERALALRVARLRETIDVVAADLTPHVLCTYLYDLAGDFMRFYETCPVLQAVDDATRLARLRLCDLAARTLKLGLGLLGIETIERM